jgi:hypothetical protein
LVITQNRYNTVGLSEQTKVFQSSGASILGKEEITKNKQKGGRGSDSTEK